MPLADFTEEYASTKVSNFPKLRLEKGETKRIACLEKPYFAYAHTLKAPRIEGGKTVMETRNRKDGSEYETLAMDFIGRPLCLGDEGILRERGVDPKNCPMCEEASTSDMIAPPERRFAMNVGVYDTKPGSFEVITPYSIHIVVWSFTEKTFAKLYEYAQEWEGGLKSHDLQLGPCKSKEFQSFDIGISARAEWALDEDRKRHTALAFKENATADLENSCGRRTERRWIEEDIEQIKKRWRSADGSASEPSAVDKIVEDSNLKDSSLTDGLDGLLSQNSGSTPSSNGDDFMSLVEDTPVAGKPGSSGETISFEDLLS